MDKLTETNAALLCAHTKGVYRQGYRLVCVQCSSFRDIESSSQEYRYTDAYLKQRYHCDNKEIGSLKIKTMLAWLKAAGLLEKIKSMRVCEVGFGGGACLEYLHETALGVWGIEITRFALENAAHLGIPKQNLYSYADVPKKLPQEIDLWLFQDSFEHIEKNIELFLQWVENNSSARARVLLVAPEACSLSQKVMGRYWPHKMPDHLFHWSYSGLCEMVKKFHFNPAMKFFPVKYVNLTMVFAHLFIKFNLSRKIREKIVPNISFPFNFGEMGIVFERNAASL